MSPQRLNPWLRYGGPALVIFGLGYLFRALDEREYASEQLHLYLVLASLAAVIIGLALSMGDKR